MRLARWLDGEGREWVGHEDGDTLRAVATVDSARAGDRALVELALRARAGEAVETVAAVPAATVRRLAPVRRPGAIRDFYAFEQHVRTAREGPGLEMDPGWYELPVFYFSNPHTVYGPEDTIPPPRSDALDYELEVAVVTGRDLRDATPDQALDAIAGYTVFNDFSARDLQAAEMRHGLGPAKGKDFACALGPVLVTPDELAGRPERPAAQMTARINGVVRSRGRLEDLQHTFATMLAYASRDSLVRAGDVIGSGTVGSGCLLELRITSDPAPDWLQPGDVVELEVEGIGTLRNRIGER